MKQCFQMTAKCINFHRIFESAGISAHVQFVRNVKPGIKRIKILDFEQSSRKAKCTLVDFGITAWIEYNEILEINADLLTITERSTRFSLADINMLLNPTEIKIDNIKCLLQNQHLIAEGQCLLESSHDSEPTVEAIFYQMRNGEKINLNVEIGMANSKWFQPIGLDMQSLMKAMVTHINHEGIIYCHFSDM